MPRRPLISRPEDTPPPKADLPAACRACPLHRLPTFRRCSPREQSSVDGMKRRQLTVARGSVLPRSVRAGAIYTLYEGWATRIHELPDGSKQILDFLLPGDLVGLPAALLGRSNQKLEAVTALTLCELDSKHLPVLLRRYPGLASSMLMAQLHEAERADRRLTSVGRMGAAERIAYLMLDLRHRLQQRGVETEPSLPFPLQRMQIADAVGLSKVHVMRALKDLRSHGLALIENRRLVIPNAAKLARLCNYSPAPDVPGGRTLF